MWVSSSLGVTHREETQSWGYRAGMEHTREALTQDSGLPPSWCAATGQPSWLVRKPGERAPFPMGRREVGDPGPSSLPQLLA